MFPSAAAARAYGQPRRRATSVADRRLSIDEIHPSARAHAILGAAVEDALLADLAAPTRVTAQAAQAAPAPMPAPVPLPPAALALGAALGGPALIGRRRARARDPARAQGA